VLYVLFVFLVLRWQRFELIVIHEQGRTIAGKQDIEQCACVRDPLDRASAACVQPMHALIRANALARSELVSHRRLPFGIVRELQRTIRHSGIRGAAGMPVQLPEW
jgi:hypothetical protein